MKDIDNLLTSSKNLSKKNQLRTKSFGYQVLGFGAGGAANPYICATGGTITTSGNDRIHTFTGPGTFTVCTAAKCAAHNLVSYLVVAGGGGAGTNLAGGGGGGGFREVKSPSNDPYTASPLDGYPNSPNRITVSAQGYPITVGAGGTGAPNCDQPCQTSGANSVFSTITSAGGGLGGCATIPTPHGDGSDGGSGGGEAGGSERSQGSGNTPPTTPAQGNDGGPGSGGGQFPHLGAGGGGGATAAGGPGTSSAAGAGGAGAGTLISPASGQPGPGPSQYYSGGAGGGLYSGSNWGAAGIGGAGTAGPGDDPARCGTANTGGGAAGYGSGGSGIVVIRYKYQ